MKLLRTIRLDPSDTFVFERAAEPGEWAVSGAFMFAELETDALEGKARAAFRSGFLGVASLGWSTLVQIVEAGEDERAALVETLAMQLQERLGAPDVATARAAAAVIDARVGSLGLRTKPEKAADLYVTPAGRASTDWADARGTSSIPFVGTAVLATGTVALNRKKLRGVLRELERRAFRSAATVSRSDQAAVGRAVCSALNQAIARAPGPLQHASAPLLLGAVTDRGQLAQVDYWLARTVVRAVTGDAGVKALRQVPYRRVREEWGLVSLEHARNTRA